MSIPSSPTSGYEILPATPTDIPSIVTIFYAAFASDDAIGNLERACDPTAREARSASWHRTEMENSNLTGAHYYKAVQKSTGEIVGFGKWDFPVKLTEQEKEEKKRLRESLKEAAPLEGANVGLAKEFLGALAERREKWRDGERDYFMHILAVHPSHHRRSIGARLLAVGLEKADAEGARCYIEASRTGLPLYKRHGWVEVDRVVVDLAKHGHPELGIYEEPCLFREPKTGASKDDVKKEAEEVVAGGFKNESVVG